MHSTSYASQSLPLISNHCRNPGNTPDNLSNEVRDEVQNEELSLQNLHGKLQQETEKIVHWKISTEALILMKDKALNVSQKTIETLRNNLLEQQLNSECLSQKLIQEKRQREIAEENCSRTRNLCSALQDHHKHLATSVSEFASVREYLKNQQDEIKNQSESYRSKIVELTTTYKRMIEDLTTKSNAELSVLEKQNSDLLGKLTAKECELYSSVNICEFKDLVIAEFCQKVFNLEEKLQNSNALYQWNRAKVEDMKISIRKERDELNRKVLDLKSVNCELETKLKTEVEKLMESRSEFEEAAEKVKDLTRYNLVLEGNKEEMKLKLEAYENSKHDLEKKIEYLYKNLEDQQNCLAERENLHLKEKLDLERIIQCHRDEVEEMSNKYSLLMENCKAQEGKIESLSEEKVCFERKLEEKLSENSVLMEKVAAIEDEIKVLQDEREVQKLKFETLQTSLEKFEKEIAEIEQSKSALNDEIKLLKSDIEKKEDLLRNVEKVKESLKEENQNVYKSLEKAKADYKEVKKSLQSERKKFSQEKKKKAKLQQQVRNIETNLKKKEVSFRNITDNLKKTGNGLKTENEELKVKNKALNDSVDIVEEKCKTMETTHKKEVSELKKEIKILEGKISESEQKARAAEMEADSKIKEIMDLSECWKKDSEAVIDTKDNEIAKIKNDNEALKASLSAVQHIKDDLSKTITDLMEKVHNKEEELEELTKKFNKKADDFTSLQTAIKRLSSSPKKSDCTAALHTPSPSEYLPLCRSLGSHHSSMSSTESERVIDAGTTASKSGEVLLDKNNNNNNNKRSGILKHNAQLNGNKNVSFCSPVTCQHIDSDSSEGIPVDVGSDLEDKFEKLKRSSIMRKGFMDNRPFIPKANIQPLPRGPIPSPSLQGNNNGTNVRTGGIKRPRPDRSIPRTYISQRSKREGVSSETSRELSLSSNPNS